MSRHSLALLFTIFLAFLYGIFYPSVPYGTSLAFDAASLADTDVLIIYNSGGFGRTPLEGDKQWGSVVKEMQSLLEGWGYATVLVGYDRTGGVPFGIFPEVAQCASFYPFKAEKLAEEINSLTQQNTNLKVIMAGISQGACFTNAVMRLLEENQQVYGIEAGLPFVYERFPVERSLELNSNGAVPDALHNGDLMVLLESYFSAPLKSLGGWLQGLPFGIIDCIQTPGHAYYWDTPGVHSQITAFLEENFGQGRARGDS